MQWKNKLLILSFFLLNLFGWISFVEFRFGIPMVVKYILSVSVLGILIWYRFNNPFKPVTGGLFYLVVIIFVTGSLLLIISSILRFDGLFFLQRILGQRYFFIPYLLPILILYTKFDLEFFSDLFHYSFLFIIPTMAIQLFIILFSLSRENWVEQAGLIRIFDIGSTFLLLTAHFSKRKYVFYIILCYYLLWTFMWSFYGRRGMLVDNMIVLLIMAIIRLRSSLLKLSDRIRIYFFGFLLLILFLLFGNIFTSTYAFQRGFDSNAFEESRGSVFETFFYDFHSTSDWIIGRGLDGTVLRTFFSDEEYTAIENGFLTVLLKGGLIYLVPFLLILLRAVYLGFYKSNNDIMKALASSLLIFIIMMGYFNLPDYSTPYIFVWISASACFTPELRHYSNEEIYQVINSRKR